MSTVISRIYYVTKPRLLLVEIYYVTTSINGTLEVEKQCERSINARWLINKYEEE